jgi:hypothetical protein
MAFWYGGIELCLAVCMYNIVYGICRDAKYAKIRGSAYQMHSIVCSMQGHSAEYVDAVMYFGVFCLISDVHSLHAMYDSYE